MQIRLSPAAQRFVRQLVIDEEYGSVDEVVAAALAYFAREKLRQDIAVAAKDIREGRVSDWDLKELERDLLQHVKRSKKKAS